MYSKYQNEVGQRENVSVTNSNMILAYHEMHIKISHCTLAVQQVTGFAAVLSYVV